MMSRRIGFAALLLLLLALLSGCSEAEPTTEGETRPLLPQIIQITVIPEPTETPADTPIPVPTTPVPTVTPTVAPPTPAPTVEPMSVEPADVTSFQVEYGQGFPVPVTLTVQGMFHDACSEIGRVAQGQTAEGLIVGMYLARPLDRTCVTKETPFEIEVPLDISGLDVGAYPLSVNGVEGELRLELGMVATQNPDLLCAEPGEGQKQARIEYGDDAYCFVYPEDYDVVQVPGSVIVTARERSDVEVPLIGEVRINYLGSPGESALAQVAEDDLEGQGLAAAEDAWTDTFLGQEPALEVSPVTGGEEPTRNLYAEHNATVYRLIFAPQLPVGAGEQGELARALYELVSSSFVFYR